MGELLPRISCLVFLLASANSSAQDEDRSQILAIIDKAFSAVTSQLPEDWRAIQLPNGTTLSMSATPGGEPELLNRLNIASNDDFIADSAPDGHEYIERWTSEPTVMIRGPIAVVWGEFDFHADGEFSHCGVNSVDLVKVDGQWKIANWMWTTERVGCPTAP